MGKSNLTVRASDTTLRVNGSMETNMAAVMETAIRGLMTSGAVLIQPGTNREASEAADTMLRSDRDRIIHKKKLYKHGKI